MQELRVEKTDPTLPQAVALIAQLDEYHRTLYPDESVHRITPAALKQTGAVFLCAWLNDRRSDAALISTTAESMAS